MWTQTYNPLDNNWLSTAAAAVPAVVLLAGIGWFKLRVHMAAFLGTALAFVVAVGVYKMPCDMAGASCVYGAIFGLFPIGWILLNVIFFYDVTTKCGQFEALRRSLSSIAPDPRIQLILIAFAFGAFLEGVAGFGAPVAITATILIQLGFRPVEACVSALIANTVPVAFGSVGIPITTLAEVTGIDSRLLSAMAGKQLAFFSLVTPFWLVVIFAGWRGALGVLPAALMAGAAFVLPMLLLSVFHGPWLVGPVAGLSAIAGLMVLLRFWKPAEPWGFDQNGRLGPDGRGGGSAEASAVAKSSRRSWAPWAPWILLTICVLIWGIPQVDAALDRLCPLQVKMPHLHQLVQRMPPVAPVGRPPEKAIIKLNFLSATGTGILLAAVIYSYLSGLKTSELCALYGRTLWRIRFSLLTIAVMLAWGALTRYSGADGTLGLALAHTGRLYPFFGPILGWLGVVFTGSDTSSNVLFGSLQGIAARQIGVSPVLMAAANSAGGVMGKMISAQSIVVGTTATDSYGQEGVILRRVFFHSVGFVILMGALVYVQSCIFPFTLMVPHP